MLDSGAEGLRFKSSMGYLYLFCVQLITEHRVPELIPVLGSQPADDVSNNPAAGCHYFPPGPQLPSQPLRGLLPISLLDEQTHDGCKQFA